MVAWAGLDPINDWVYVLNHEFLNSIFIMFFTEHSWDKHADKN